MKQKEIAQQLEHQANQMQRQIGWLGMVSAEMTISSGIAITQKFVGLGLKEGINVSI